MSCGATLGERISRGEGSSKGFCLHLPTVGGATYPLPPSILSPSFRTVFVEQRIADDKAMRLQWTKGFLCNNQISEKTMPQR